MEKFCVTMHARFQFSHSIWTEFCIPNEEKYREKRWTFYGFPLQYSRTISPRFSKRYDFISTHYKNEKKSEYNRSVVEKPPHSIIYFRTAKKMRDWKNRIIQIINKSYQVESVSSHSGGPFVPNFSYTLCVVAESCPRHKSKTFSIMPSRTLSSLKSKTHLQKFPSIFSRGFFPTDRIFLGGRHVR